MSNITRKITRNQLKDLYIQQCKEIERLKTELQDTKEHLGEYLHEQEEENKRLNNIINELKKKLLELKLTDVDGKTIVYRLLDKLQELKGDDKND